MCRSGSRLSLKLTTGSFVRESVLSFAEICKYCYGRSPALPLPRLVFGTPAVIGAGCWFAQASGDRGNHLINAGTAREDQVLFAWSSPDLSGSLSPNGDDRRMNLSRSRTLSFPPYHLQRYRIRALLPPLFGRLWTNFQI